MSSDRTTVLMLKAIKAKFESVRDENLAIAAHYISKGAGVADHPKLVEDAVDAIRKACEAEECLAFMSSDRFEGILEHTTEVGKFFNKMK